MYTDPIADLLTRMRNANMAGLTWVTVPSSKNKKAILRVMQEKGFIEKVEETAGESPVEKLLKIKMDPDRKINLKRVSKPGQRIYKKFSEIFPVVRGYGISIISTSQGIMTGDEAKKKKIGGEMICEIH